MGKYDLVEQVLAQFQAEFFFSWSPDFNQAAQPSSAESRNKNQGLQPQAATTFFLPAYPETPSRLW